MAKGNEIDRDPGIEDDMHPSHEEMFLWLFLFLCILQALFPELFWSLSEGWKIRGDSDPSDAWLFLTRVGSVIGIIVSAYMIYSGKHTGVWFSR
jgi:hypothetical protein